MVANEFASNFVFKLMSSLQNNYDDNHDFYRYGKIPTSFSLKKFLFKNFFQKKYVNRFWFTKYAYNAQNLIGSYFDQLQWLYSNLENDESRQLMIDLLAYRVLGMSYVKLPLNTPVYWDNFKKAEKLICKEDHLFLKSIKWDLPLNDLSDIGYNLKIYFPLSAIVANFIEEQYAYRSKNRCIVAQTGDYVIDAGGCFGDTAFYFASKIGKTGKVFSFEFIPNNIEVFKKNLSINPDVSDIITIVDRPLWDESGKDTYFIDHGPGSKVSFEMIEGYDGISKTISIDDYVTENKIVKIDFIKMDIEGAEPYALKGAEMTIRKFKPNLAITIYHSLDDFVNIPKWIHDLDLGYKLYMGHYTIHLEETVIFATTK